MYSDLLRYWSFEVYTQIHSASVKGRVDTFYFLYTVFVIETASESLSCFLFLHSPPLPSPPLPSPESSDSSSTSEDEEKPGTNKSLHTPQQRRSSSSFASLLDDGRYTHVCALRYLRVQWICEPVYSLTKRYGNSI